MRSTNAFQKLQAEGLLWFAEQLDRPTDESSSFRAKVDLFKTTPFGVDNIDNALPAGGLRTAAVHEFFVDPLAGPACTILAVLISNAIRVSIAAKHFNNRYREEAFFNDQRNTLFPKLIVWIGKECWPTPFLLARTLVVAFESSREPKKVKTIDALGQCIFIDPVDTKLRRWCIETSLRSPAVSVVVAELAELPFAISRRFTLSAKEGGALGLIIRPDRRNDSSCSRGSTLAASRWRVLPEVEAVRSQEATCWRLELLSCKGIQKRERVWIVEAVENEAVSLHIPSTLAVYSEQTQTGIPGTGLPSGGSAANRLKQGSACA